MSTDVSESVSPPTRVHVDQVGYLPSARKVAVTPVDAQRFAVVDVDDGEVAHAGSLSEQIDDPDAGEAVRWASFTALRSRGTYRVAVGTGEDVEGGLTETVAQSPAFTVAPDVYDDTLVDCVRLYSLKRSNTAIEDLKTGLDVAAGHTRDAHARLFYTHGERERGDGVDVSGGWYDAGDYGKYVPPAAVTVGQLLLAYERFPDAFESGQCDLPPGLSRADRDAGLPDLLVEAKFELEWLERMQRPDGAVYHKVAAAEWPDLDEAPTEDRRERYVYGSSTFGTAQFAAAMAMAARVYEPFDPAFAERALSNAREAHEYLVATPDPYFRFDEGQADGSGPYRKETDDEERFWATAELLKTTGESRYADHLDAEHADLFDAPVRAPVWSDTLSLGQWAYVSCEGGRPDPRRTLESALVTYADDLVASIDSDGYRDALATEDYHWASTKLALSKGGLLLLADHLESDDRYVAGALDQLHYALGRTPTGYSYVTGQGTYPTQNPHDRLVESTGTYLPGMVVSGANRNGDDEVLAEYIDRVDPAPAKCYVDVMESFSANEWAIDYTAPIFLLLGHAVTAER